jgi:hypothetical protein
MTIIEAIVEMVADNIEVLRKSLSEEELKKVIEDAWRWVKEKHSTQELSKESPYSGLIRTEGFIQEMNLFIKESIENISNKSK